MATILYFKRIVLSSQQHAYPASRQISALRVSFYFILVAVRTQVAYILILSMIVYLLDIINPNHLFVTRFKDLLNRYPSIDVRAMGFPANWENEDIWK